MNTRLLIPLLLAGAGALACGSRSRSQAATVRPGVRNTTAVADAPAPPHRASAAADSASIRLAPAFVVTTKDRALRFDLAIRNEGKKHVELTFPSGQTYDFAVVDGRGREVYRWGNGRMFTQSRQNRMLDGGDTMRIEESAAPELAPGSYVAVATLHSSNYPVEQRVAFELR
ncbi:MAG: Intracellular proteinase inhibitor [Gemmatimonadetes bacterium]|jgi:hypothetical protein|nr:Intracellular proteinase inhibitor [Gemmatimonadota bacterium]